jgi:hypothetical protein
MIPKSGYRYSAKIMLIEQAKAKWRFNLKPFALATRWPIRPAAQCVKIIRQLASSCVGYVRGALGRFRAVVSMTP